MVHFRLVQHSKEGAPCPKWRDLRADVASACCVPLVVFKRLQVLINLLNLGLAAAIWVTAGVFSKEHR